MLWNNKKIFLFLLVLIFPFTLMAKPNVSYSQGALAKTSIIKPHVLVAPVCLIKGLKTNIKTLAASNGLVLLEANQAELDALIAAKHRHGPYPCGGFLDTTHAWDKYQSHDLYTTAHPDQRAALFLKQYENNPARALHQPKTKYSIKYKKQVNQLLNNVFDPKQIWPNLLAFANTDQFPDRYANSDTGVAAASWIEDKIKDLAKENHRQDITVYTVDTGGYVQPSVVVKIGDSKEAGVVIGGHMDTLSSFWELKPGADDDGSGSMTLMEVARTLIASGMQFKKPIYLIWYAAEEEGLVGSSYVVEDFQNKEIPVDAVLQFDMTGYVYKKDPTIWLITDDVNQDLTKFLEALIKTYVKQPVGHTRCGYACSDHATWYQAGYTASFPFEASFNYDDPYIHTSRDTADLKVLSPDHMRDFAKLGIAFAVELAEPTDA